MPYLSRNPATNQILQTFPGWDASRLQRALEQTSAARQAWARTDIAARAAVLRDAVIGSMPITERRSAT